MGAARHIWDKGTVKTMDRKRRISSKGGKDNSICRQGHCVSFFWNGCGIIFIDYFHKQKTINGEYYANLLQRLSAEIKNKKTKFGKKESVVSSQQCTCSQIYACDGKNQ